MTRSLFRDRFLISSLLLALLTKLFSLNAVWVEQYYSNGLYRLISTAERFLLGWVPVSIGDLVYIAAGICLAAKGFKFIKLLMHRRLKEYLTGWVVRKYIRLLLVIYLLFTISWGLNYYRQGITGQLAMGIKPYSKEDLFTLTNILEQRLTFYAEKTDSAARLGYNENKSLFDTGISTYKNAAMVYPFLKHQNPSAKPSLFSPLAKFIGFTGYYNPFTAEAQIKTSIPVFLKPFVLSHEIAHQLGYAKENEASFVGYLACKNSGNKDFLYSAYFELFRDALFECLKTGDTLFVKSLREKLSPRVRYDLADLRKYLAQNENFIEPFMSGAYDRYLKFNNQPHGKATYNEVVAYLVAYMKKFGAEAI